MSKTKEAWLDVERQAIRLKTYKTVEDAIDAARRAEDARYAAWEEDVDPSVSLDALSASLTKVFEALAEWEDVAKTYEMAIFSDLIYLAWMARRSGVDCSYRLHNLLTLRDRGSSARNRLM